MCADQVPFLTVCDVKWYIPSPCLDALKHGCPLEFVAYTGFRLGKARNQEPPLNSACRLQCHFEEL